MTRPDFATMAREWLVQATGHAPPPREASLATALERAYELGRQAGPGPEVCGECGGAVVLRVLDLPDGARAPARIANHAPTCSAWRR